MKNKDDYYFGLAQKLAKNKSTCLKIQTGVVIVKNGRIVSQGFNLCSPEGFSHGRKVKKCRRLSLTSGSNYELCRSIHAEMVAVAKAQPKDLVGATVYLTGHYYPCWHCESTARLCGVKQIKVKDLGAKDFYRRKNIKK